MEGWSRFLDTFFKWEVIERYFPAIMKGVAVTIEIAAAVVISGLVLGLALALLRSWRVLPLSALIVVFADVLRALPPLVLVLLVYFGLPNVGINLSSFVVLWLVLTLGTVGQAVALAVVLAMTVYGEFRSISALVDRNPLLRQLDSLGRPA